MGNWIKNIGLINIVAEKQVAVELIQNDFTAERAAQEIEKLLDPTTNLQKRQELKVIREKIGSVGASERAANAILDFMANG